MSDLEQLKRASVAFGYSDTAKARAAHREVLSQDPAHEWSANRLGVVLFNLEKYDEAAEVFEAAVAASPGNEIAVKRLYAIRRRLANPPKPVKVPAKRKVRTGPAYWVKAIQAGNDDWSIAPGEESWISDIGRRDPEGNRVYAKDGTPANRPSWRVGDEVGLYYGGTLKVPVLVEITAPPEFNPAKVAERDGSEEAGERWPWVTHVRGICAVDLDKAPTLSDLGIESSSVMRRSRFGIDADTHARLSAALT
jgi:tetratricopeptide (TPR) repeat protein